MSYSVIPPNYKYKNKKLLQNYEDQKYSK